MNVNTLSNLGPDDDAPLITPLCAIFRRSLKQKGLRFTVGRALILSAVLKTTTVFEADDLVDGLKSEGERLARASVYRNLKHLVDAGILREVILSSERTHYELAFGKAPTGHIINMETQQVIEFPTSELDQNMREICEANGFQPLSHRFVIYAVPKDAGGEENTSES